MAICSRCGAPCGYRNLVSIWGHEYYCDKCRRTISETYKGAQDFYGIRQSSICRIVWYKEIG